jgi:hypothetical protein
VAKYSAVKTTETPYDFRVDRRPPSPCELSRLERLIVSPGNIESEYNFLTYVSEDPVGPYGAFQAVLGIRPEMRPQSGWVLQPLNVNVKVQDHYSSTAWRDVTVLLTANPSVFFFSLDNVVLEPGDVFGILGAVDFSCEIEVIDD